MNIIKRVDFQKRLVITIILCLVISICFNDVIPFVKSQVRAQQAKSIKPVMTSSEFCRRALDTAENKKTVYVMGGYGTTLNSEGKNYSYRTFEYNRRDDRWRYIANADDNTFGFDCVCFVKGLLWGFTGDNTKPFGGAKYGSNGVYDFTCEEMIDVYCYDKSNDFTDIEAGEVLYMKGHVGIYVGDGIVCESSPRWGNGVQKTTLGNIGYTGPNSRTWLYHGHLKYIDYVDQEKPEPEKPVEPETPIIPQTEDQEPLPGSDLENKEDRIIALLEAILVRLEVIVGEDKGVG